MSIAPLYKYEFLNEAGEYFTRDFEGNVSTTTTQTSLPESPKGWETVRHQFLRDEKWFGVFRKMTAPLSFHGYAADILRSLWETPNGYNYDAYCKLRIWKRDPITFEYTIDFEGEIDFSRPSDGTKETDNNFVSNIFVNDEPYFTVPILQKGLAEKLEANANTPYEYGADNTAVSVAIDGIKITSRYKWLVGDLFSAGYVAIVNGNNSAAQRYVLPLGFVEDESNEYFSKLLQTQTQQYELSLRNAVPGLEEGFLTSSIAITINYTVTGSVDYDANGAANWQFGLQHHAKNTLQNTVGTAVLYTSPVLVSSGNQQFTATGTLNIQNSEITNFLVFVTQATSGGGTSYLRVRGLTFEFTLNQQLPQTTSQGFKLLDLFKKLAISVSENTATGQSNHLSVASYGAQQGNYQYYNNKPANQIAFAGDAIRVLSSWKLKTTLDDFFRHVHSTYMMGLGITDNTIFIERLDYFFNRNSEISALGQVKNLRKEIAEDFIYNQIRIGYEEQDYDEVNGRYETNLFRVYNNGIKSIAKELDLISPYRTDVYGIEQARAKSFGQNTTDTGEDNNVFVIDTNGAGGLNRIGSNLGMNNGDTTYNVTLRPEFNALRWNAYWKSILNVPSGVQTYSKKLTYQTGEKYVVARSIINGIEVKGNQDIYPGGEPVSQGISKLFLPVIYTFEYEPEYNLLSLIQANPYGYIEFIDNQKVYRGFILDVEITSAQIDLYKFRLLGCPL